MCLHICSGPVCFHHDEDEALTRSLQPWPVSGRPSILLQMSDPLALLPYALAAAGGGVSGHLGRVPAGAAVAAGLTLLQRAPTLLRALGTQPVIAYLPTGVAWVTTLAIGDGRGVVWVDPVEGASALREAIVRSSAGVVCTTRHHAADLAPDQATVWLDEAPRSAEVELGGVSRVVDLGSHVGLSLEGDPDVEGRDERCLAVGDRWWSHRALLAATRAPAGMTLPGADARTTDAIAWLRALLAGAWVEGSGDL